MSSGRIACSQNAYALGGVPHEGQKVVRFVFLDEGGISKYEPFAVVAGVVVHGDTQLIPLEREIRKLVLKYIPEEHQEGFVFHATEIWSGTGKIFGNKDQWTLDRRMMILRDLARIPRRLDIPIVHESYERKKLLELSPGQKPPEKKPTEHELSVAANACAFAACTLRIDEYMQAFYRDEVAQIVAEDNDQSRKMIKSVHHAFRYPMSTPGIDPNNRLPLKHIRTGVYFAGKEESAALQIADLCAFLIRGRLVRKPHHERLNSRLYDRLKSMMYMFASDDENYYGPQITARPPYVVQDEQSPQRHVQTFRRLRRHLESERSS